MIVDFDDFHENNHRLDLLHQLHDANPAFCCTLFAVPGCGSDRFWSLVPDWCELAVHGWFHPTPLEARNWTYEQAMDVLLSAPVGFVDGFKAPGWQISDGTYLALMELGWWCADHPENNHRRPEALSSYVLPDGAASGTHPECWHGHIQNVCGNGLEETFPKLLEFVKNAIDFQFVSEVVIPWPSPVTV